ncbi:MAG TPA: tRNA lysidine(34) synthetase TilS [Solirubrobacterales bacterium]
MTADAYEQLAATVRESGLVPPGSSGVALLSGGPDSACLAAGLAGALGAAAVAALHLNYGLRDDSDEDEAACRELCERLGIELTVERPQLEDGNLQDAAREERYAAAEQLRARLGGDWIALGHTRTDLAETVLYRLASSPGRRAMLGLAPRRGHVVRPLLALDRAETRRLATEAGLPFHDDPSNLDRRFARVRIREEVLPVLREINPAAEQNVASTWQELAEEAEALEALAAEALEAAAPAGATAVQTERLAELAPAIRRLALRTLAERVAGREVALGPSLGDQIWRLANQPEGGETELGGGLRAICEAGLIRFAADAEAEPEPAQLAVPGSCRFGRWEVRAELRPGPIEPIGPDVATLDAAALGDPLEVRAWRDGDRMRPLGLGGTKSLQDLFTDSRVPRSLRHTLPVVASGGRIAWVAGVAVSDEFKLTPDAGEAAVLTAALVE